MARRSLLPGFLMAICCSTAFCQPWTADLLDHTDHDFGTVARGAKAEHAFLLQNRTAEEIHVAMVRSSCGCATVRIRDGKRSVAPGQSTAIVAAINSTAFVGARSATITVTLDKPAAAELQLHVKVHVRGDVAIQPGRVEFGAVAGGRAAERSIQVSSSGRYSWGIVEVKCPHPHLRCEVAETGRAWSRVSYEVRVHLDREAAPGYLRDHLTLVTNEPQQREILVPVEARILPEITVSPSALFLGVVQPGQEVNRQLVVHGKKPFRIVGMKADGESLAIDFQTSNTPKPLHLVPVTFRARSQPGQVMHTIHIETDLEGGAIAVPASALVGSSQPVEKSLSQDRRGPTHFAESSEQNEPVPLSRPIAPKAIAGKTPPADPASSWSGRLPIFQRLLTGSSHPSQPGSPTVSPSPRPTAPAGGQPSTRPWLSR